MNGKAPLAAFCGEGAHCAIPEQEHFAARRLSSYLCVLCSSRG